MKKIRLLAILPCFFVAIPCYGDIQVFGGDEARGNALQEKVQNLMERTKERGPRFSLNGEVKPGRTSPYAINGVDFHIGADTLIQGNFRIGAKAYVHGDILAQKKKVARYVTVDAGKPERAQESNEEPGA